MTRRQEAYSGLYTAMMLLVVLVCIFSAVKKAAIRSSLEACDAKVQAAIVAKQQVPKCAS